MVSYQVKIFYYLLFIIPNNNPIILSYNERNSYLYLISRFATEYAIIFQILNEVIICLLMLLF